MTRQLARLLPLRRPALLPAPPQARRAVARRAVAWGVAAVVIANLGLAVAVDTILPSIRQPEHGNRLAAVRRLEGKCPDRPLVLVLGSSRTQNALSPAAMALPDGPGEPVVFNYGQVGTLPGHLPILDRRLRACGVRPRAMLVELFPAVLGVEDVRPSQFGDGGVGLTAAERVRLFPLASDPRDRWIGSRLHPWYTFRGTIRPAALDAWITDYERNVYRAATYCDWYGFTPLGYNPFGTQPVTDDARRGQTKRVQESHAAPLADLQVSALAVESYRRLVADCRARGTPVAFYVTPESPTYQSWYTPQSRATLAAFVRALRDLGCPVFDAPTDLTEEDFADGHHMISDGAAKYSRWLADAHLRPWFAEVLK